MEAKDCKTCDGVGRVDCCDNLDCVKCDGMGTAYCPDCSSLNIRLDIAERQFQSRQGS